MKTKRNLACLLAVLLAFSLLLTACGGGGSKYEEPEEEEEEAEEPEEPEEEQGDEEPGQSLLWGTEEETTEEEAPAEEDTEEPQGMGRLHYWDHHEYEMSLTINDDGTAILSDAWEEIEVSCIREGRNITLINEGEEEHGELLDDGSIQFETLEGLFVPTDTPTYVPAEEPEDVPADDAPAEVPSDAEWSVEARYNYHLEGLWEYYDDETLTLYFDGENYVEFSLGDREGTGTYRFDGENLEIMCDNGTMMRGDIDWEGDLWLDDYSNWFVADREDYFKEMNLDPNWEADGYAYTAETGARYYYPDGSHYEIQPAEWEIIQNNEINTGDGFRELEFTMYCGFLPEVNPQLDGEYSYGCQFGVFDAYTGYMLTIDNTYYDASLDAYVYEYTANGKDIRLECNYTTLWEENVDGYEFRLTIDLALRIPDDYDGARIVALGSKPTFEEQSEGYLIALRPYENVSEVSEGLVFKVN